MRVAAVQLPAALRNTRMQLFMMLYSRAPSSLLGSMSRPKPDPKMSAQAGERASG